MATFQNPEKSTTRECAIQSARGQDRTDTTQDGMDHKAQKGRRPLPWLLDSTATSLRCSGQGK